jgi:hypothetical protein
MSEQETNEAPTQTGTVCYIGPNLSVRGLAQYQVFKGGIPSAHAGDPVLCRLFVPVADLRQAQAALRAEGSPEWSAYRDALSAFSKRGA